MKVVAQAGMQRRCPAISKESCGNTYTPWLSYSCRMMNVTFAQAGVVLRQGPNACLSLRCTPLQMSVHMSVCAVQAVTLLLHQANVPEALKQFQQHMSAFRRVPLPPPPAAASAHGTWLVRQYTVMGELLSSRVEAGLLPQQVPCLPSLPRAQSASFRNADILKERIAAR